MPVLSYAPVGAKSKALWGSMTGKFANGVCCVWASLAISPFYFIT